jgi:hypothetical protein
LGYILIESPFEQEAATNLKEDSDQIDVAMWFRKGGWIDHPNKPGVFINPKYPNKEGRFVEKLPENYSGSLVHLLPQWLP